MAKVPARWAKLLGLALGLLLAFLVHVGVGSTIWYRPDEVAREILRGGGHPEGINSIVWQIRLPRAVVALLVGGLLGGVGSAFQAIFRNPLADPYIVGVSSGAAVGGALAIVTGVSGAFWGLGGMLCAFAAGLLSLALVTFLAGSRGKTDVSALLLAGVVVGALLSSVLSLVLLAAGQDSGQVLRWLLGSTTPAFWPTNLLLLVTLSIGLPILLRETRRLNAFAVGEDAATRLGVDVRRLKQTVLITGTAMTAAAVGAVGIVGFLGLVAPHIARRLVGVDWRMSLLASSLIGAILLLVADVIGQRGVRGTELQVGIVTALLGAPSLLILMRQQTRPQA